MFTCARLQLVLALAFGILAGYSVSERQHRQRIQLDQSGEYPEHLRINEPFGDTLAERRIHNLRVYCVSDDKGRMIYTGRAPDNAYRSWHLSFDGGRLSIFATESE